MSVQADLRGRRMVVTGASRGIGAAFAGALLRAGARVALVARDEERLRGVLGEADGIVVPADLLAVDADALVAQCVDGLGGLDGWINCAGVVTYEAALALTPGSLDRQLRVNFTQPLLLAVAAARHMVDQGGGDIISVASTLGEQPAPLTAAYSASKAALLSATRTLAMELGPSNIRVNAIAPGVIDTDMVRVPRLRPGEAPLSPQEAQVRVEAQLAGLRRLHVLGRLGRPEDLLGALEYLLSSTWLTGTVLTVDGGLSLGAPEQL